MYEEMALISHSHEAHLPRLPQRQEVQQVTTLSAPDFILVERGGSLYSLYQQPGLQLNP